MATKKDDTVKSIEQNLEQHARKFVEIFAEGWQAPRSAVELVEHVTPWLTDDFRFTQPLLRGQGVGHAQVGTHLGHGVLAEGEHVVGEHFPAVFRQDSTHPSMAATPTLIVTMPCRTT